MTESDWLASTDPQAMLEYLRGKASERKLRLFAVACYRPARNSFSKITEKAVDVAERFADGEASSQDLSQAFRLARGARRDWKYVQRFRLHQSAWDMAEAWANDAARTVASEALRQSGHMLRPRTAQGLEAKLKERRKEVQARQTYEDAWWPERKAQADLLRCIFGASIRPLALLPPAVLAWNDRLVPRLAQTIYDDRRLPEGTLDTSSLAIIADALLDAGADDDTLLEHLRSPGPHVRGCHAVDLILGRS